MLSKMVEGMRARMDGMSEQEFEDMLGLSKSSFLNHLDKKAAIEARCTAHAGQLAPDFSAHTLESDGSISKSLTTLSDMRGKPVSLIFGCYTCPIFRRQSKRMAELISAHADTIEFLFVYVKEAHPTDGWNTPSNRAADIMYAQPVSMEDRAKVAADWREAYGFTNPVLLDWSDNRINTEYSGSPERLYVLDPSGVVTFRSEQGPYNDDHLEDWAEALRAVSIG